MKKILFILVVLLLCSLTYVSAQVTISSNITYFTNQSHDPNSQNGIVITSLTNQTLFNISRTEIDTAPYCIITDHRTNLTLVNTTWTDNVCVANINLTVGESYRLATGANSTTYRVGINNTIHLSPGLPIVYINFISFISGCSGNNCGDSFPTTVYSINNVTVSSMITNFTNQYNSTTYETESQSFIGNYTIFSNTLSSVNLIYGGVTYLANIISSGGNNYLFSKTIDIPTGIGSNIWYWNLTYANGSTQQLPYYSQSSSGINFSICAAAPQNVNFLNFTFFNETSAQERVNASIPSSSWSYWLGTGTTNRTFTYTSSESKEYDFCFSPASKTVKTSYSLSYDNAESQQRIYSPSYGTSYTNSSTNKILFLLPSSQGQYVTFQVINTAEQTLSGVQVTASRSGIGTIESGFTDSSGSITMFLNPSFSYSLVFSKSGFTDFTTNIIPTQTAYTITMGGTSSSTNNTNSAAGMSFIILPSEKTLNNATLYNFNLTLNSSYWTLDSWGYTLQNRSGFVFASNSSTSSTGGFLSNNLNTGQNTTIVMNYFWVINGVYNNATVTWGIIDLSGNTLSIYQFFTDFRSYVGLGFFGLDDVGLGIITFFTIFLITGVMSYKFGINSPAAVMAFVFSLTLFFDVGLGLVPNPIGAIPHAPTFFMLIIFIGMFFREMGR